MSKAKLSQIATTWLDEENTSKEKQRSKKEEDKKQKEQVKKKQTFNLKVGTIKRLWIHRVKTGKTLSETMDELVVKYLPEK